MKIRASLLGSCLSFLMSLASGAKGQDRDLPRATDGHGGFGLPDQPGGRLLLMPNLARPEALKMALCGGRRVPVRFERQQVAAANDGRHTSSRFDTLAESVYTVLGSPVDPDAPCFLASEALLAGSAVLSVVAPDGAGACLQRDRLAALRDRPVVHCWPLARMAKAKQIALLEFERRGKDALASVVVVDGSRAMFADVHGEFQGAGESLWRVDDGGVLSPAHFRIVCVLQRGSWYALGTAWAGPEGQSLSLWIADGSERFTKAINDYWYQAPR